MGLETTHESLFIVHIATDDDGSLKVKMLEDFRDSKTFIDIRKSMGAAIAAAQAKK